MKLSRITLTGAAVIAALMLTGPEAGAVEDEATHFSHENLICGVYNSLVAQCVENRDPNDPLAKRTGRPRRRSLSGPSRLAKRLALSEKALMARVQIAPKTACTLKLKAPAPISRCCCDSTRSNANACWRMVKIVH